MGIGFVARLVRSLELTPHPELNSATWLSSSRKWIEYFGLAISAHHGLTVQPLMLTDLEEAFRNACLHAGWTVSERASATKRFVDLTVRVDNTVEKKLSIKSTAEKRLSRSTAKISKLTEASWIQDMRMTKSRRENTLELFRAYREAVDAIILLRAFKKGEGQVPNKYQLLEIPTAIFDSLEQVPSEAFAGDGPTLTCSYKGEPAAARVSLDRSDSKVTITGIKLSSCTLHGEWHMTEPGSLPLS